jgi:hypothetical protein
MKRTLIIVMTFYSLSIIVDDDNKKVRLQWIKYYDHMRRFRGADIRMSLSDTACLHFPGC